MEEFKIKLKEVLSSYGIPEEYICKMANINQLELRKFFKDDIQLSDNSIKRLLEVLGDKELNRLYYIKGKEIMSDIRDLNNIEIDKLKLLNKLKEELEEGIEAINYLIEDDTLNISSTSKCDFTEIDKESIYQLMDVYYWTKTAIPILINECGFDIQEINKYMEMKFTAVKQYIK